jgi:beta-glucosidase
MLSIIILCLVFGEKPWMNLRLSPLERAKELLAKMSLQEKTNMTRGYRGSYVGNVQKNDRLGIPAITMNDGPQGFRGIAGTSTAWPSGQTVGMTWDPELAYKWGAAMGVEFAQKGANVQLGPGVNVARVPQNGRNFEYLSGEDPFLGYEMVKPVINGIQDQGVIATVKHYINNNEETHRNTIIAKLEERTEKEIYSLPFLGAIEAGVMSVMCSYNKVWITDKMDKKEWACENYETLTNELKFDMNFSGWVMSDWWATHTTVKAALSGLDQEMPNNKYFGDKLMEAVHSGTMDESVVNDKVLRILTPMFAIGLFDHPQGGDIRTNTTSKENNALAREIASNGIVLLKNDDALLPIQNTNVTIALLGKWAGTTGVGKLPSHETVSSGGGSGAVQPYHVVTALEGIRKRMGANAGNVRWVSTADVSKAVDLAKASDYTTIVTMTNSGEGNDRKNLSLPWDDEILIDAVSQVTKRTIVVMNSPGAVLTPWRDNVNSIVAAFFGGQEAGNALADVLFGDVNPSGKLSITLPVKENDIGMTEQQWPGLNGTCEYSEGLEIGYRWYHANGVIPAFPFGHGLSYTTFVYSNLSVSSRDEQISVNFQLSNTGNVNGAEVAQVYLTYPPTTPDEPPRQLRAFEKVALDPNWNALVSLDIKKRGLSIWTDSGWKV